MAKRNSIQMTTPKGIAVWPHLHAPDTKFNAGGVYSTKLTLQASEAEPIIAKLEELRESYRDEAREKAKGKKLKDADLPFTENEDGTYTFNFKLNATGTRKDGTEFKQSPQIFDAALTPRPGLKVGGGSTIRVSFEASPFWTALVGLGVSLRLKAVQVIDLQTFGSRSGSDFGFGSEDGFAGEGGEFAQEETTSAQSDYAIGSSRAEEESTDEEDDF